VDVLKSRIQVLGDDAKGKELQMRHVAAQIHRREGISAFTRGMAPCVIRALPTNGVIFVVYEAVLEKLGGQW